MKRTIRTTKFIKKWRDITKKWRGSHTGPCADFKNTLLLFSVPLTDVTLSPEAVSLHIYEITRPTQFTERKWRTANVDWCTATWNAVLFCYRQDVTPAVCAHKAVAVRRISEQVSQIYMILSTPLPTWNCWNLQRKLRLYVIITFAVQCLKPINLVEDMRILYCARKKLIS